MLLLQKDKICPMVLLSKADSLEEEEVAVVVAVVAVPSEDFREEVAT